MFDINLLKLVTSNENKLNEYNSYNNAGKLQMLKGVDLPEVDSQDPLTVIIHKSKLAGNNTIVEDTSFDIEGANVGTNIRWLMDSISKYEGRKAEWVVKLAVNYDDNIYVYNGKIKGIISSPRGKDGFGFDPIFIPDGSDKTLAELSFDGSKDEYSARKEAFNNMLSNKEPVVYKVKDIPEWKGKYQKEEVVNKKTKKYKP